MVPYLSMPLSRNVTCRRTRRRASFGSGIRRTFVSGGPSAYSDKPYPGLLPQKSRRGPVALETLPPTALVTLQQRQARRHVGPSNVCGPASSPAGPQTHNSEYLSCHQRYRFRLMHAPRSILAYNPLHLNEIVRERWTVSHSTEPRRGHTIDRALLVMSPPISDSGND